MFLEVKNVTKSIHGDVVIKNVSLCSERGRVIGLRGINGLRYKLKKLSSTSLR